MNKQFLWALIATGALVGLGGCSEGDESVINIDASTNVDGGGGTDPGPGPGPEPEECPDGTTEITEGQCALPATISDDLTLVAGPVYIMDGTVTVGNGNGELGEDGNLLDGSPLQNVTLTIEAGVEVQGVTGTFANMIVTRGSRILANGTAAAPIIFSSDDEGYDGSGEWGGLQIGGFGPHNECDPNGLVCNIDGEGESGFFGGYDANDDSGSLRYVIIAEGGFEFAPGDEINGLSLHGVGAGTNIEYLQIEGNSDDGIEFYGGTVNLKYGVFTNNLDDSVDWDEGYQGNLQYILVSQSPEGSGEAFEMDTQGTDLFLSKPTLANVTVIADKRADDDEYIMRFKAGSGGFFHNTVITVPEDNVTPLSACVEVDGADSEALVGTALVLNNWIQDCAAGAGDQGVLSGANVDLHNGTIAAVFADLDSTAASQADEASGLAPLDWAAINAALPESVADASFLDSTTFIGAVNPDGSDPWWASWTLPGTVNVPEGTPVVGCPEGTTELSEGVCQLPGTIDADMNLTNNNEYIMEGTVTVGNGNGQIGEDGNLLDGTPVQNVTLTIQPGTEIKGVTGTFANMIITRGSTIEANGTASAPIIFSSDDDGYDGSGEWGGLQIGGFAPHNECPENGTVCNIDGEGESGFFGGYDPLDASGNLRYVIIAEGGFEFTPGDEINGLSLHGVGAGTNISFLQIEGNSDDGIEFYGGTANVKYGVFTNNLDDSVDWDEGYQGNLQYIIVKQSPEGSGEAFEMDTQGTDLFLSKPTVANLTIIADKREADDNYIINFKAGSGGFFHRAVVTVADGNNTPLDTCVNVDGEDSISLIGTALVLNDWIQDCAEGAGNHGSLSTVDLTAGAINVLEEDAALDDILASQAAGASGLAPIDWVEVNGTLPESVADPEFLDSTDFSGAVDPDGSNPWCAGWTLPGTLN